MASDYDRERHLPPVCGEGIKWRALPREFALPWQTVYWYFPKRDELCHRPFFPFFEAVSREQGIKGDHHFGGNKFRAGVERDSEARVEISAIAVQRPSQQVMPVHKGRVGGGANNRMGVQQQAPLKRL